MTNQSTCLPAADNHTKLVRKSRSWMTQGLSLETKTPCRHPPALSLELQCPSCLAAHTAHPPLAKLASSIAAARIPQSDHAFARCFASSFFSTSARICTTRLLVLLVPFRSSRSDSSTYTMVNLPWPLRRQKRVQNPRCPSTSTGCASTQHHVWAVSRDNAVSRRSPQLA